MPRLERRRGRRRRRPRGALWDASRPGRPRRGARPRRPWGRGGPGGEAPAPACHCAPAAGPPGGPGGKASERPRPGRAASSLRSHPPSPGPPALVDPAPQTGQRRRGPHPGKQEEPAVFGGSTRYEDDTCFRGMHSEPGKSRGSQTQLLDGFSQVTFMLDLKGAALANLLFLKPPVQFLDKALNLLSSLLEMLFSQIFI
ncbi:basic salivary proline-rich protein 3-like isoform X2 [Canis lupus familiaris]|uniref:basic salivary proline-rich protein 3-like isoform X2 n=1 Tax=Canis lupus familiaris TaxID=9615 RepID=UPI0018F40663|nr:basic salivary proline-rich protein 3-like isoform X2 [Canis lupus familiaris]